MHLKLELELCRGASDYAEPPSVSRKLIWIEGCSDCQAGRLVPNLDFRVLLFTGVAELARSLAIRVNRRSTSPAHSYSCFLVMGTRRFFPKGEKSQPLSKPLQILVTREASATTVSVAPRFAARIPDSARWFTGTL